MQKILKKIIFQKIKNLKKNEEKNIMIIIKNVKKNKEKNGLIVIENILIKKLDKENQLILILKLKIIYDQDFIML